MDPVKACEEFVEALDRSLEIASTGEVALALYDSLAVTDAVKVALLQPVIAALGLMAQNASPVKPPRVSPPAELS